MLGGGGTNGNTIFPRFVEENCAQYENNTYPQLQLFGHVPVQSNAGTGTGTGRGRINHMGNGHMLTNNTPMDRCGVGKILCTQQKLHMTLNNNFYSTQASHMGSALNHNPVSTGLKLSCEEDERNSSVTFAGDNTKKLFAMSLSNAVKMEIDRQAEEFHQYIKLQEENILKGVREISQKHTVPLLHALEKGINQKLHEKDLEIENVNQKNKELGDRIKQVSMEAQSWHYKAKYNESVVNTLKSNIQQMMAQGITQNREGSGDSDVDDAISCSNHPRGLGNERLLKCRACNVKEVCVLIMPCRHLCLCLDCQGFVDVCPVCQVRKTASVHVYM